MWVKGVSMDCPRPPAASPGAMLLEQEAPGRPGVCGEPPTPHMPCSPRASFHEAPAPHPGLAGWGWGPSFRAGATVALHRLCVMGKVFPQSSKSKRKKL